MAEIAVLEEAIKLFAAYSNNVSGKVFSITLSKTVLGVKRFARHGAVAEVFVLKDAVKLLPASSDDGAGESRTVTRLYDGLRNATGDTQAGQNNESYYGKFLHDVLSCQVKRMLYWLVF